jgi:hypothetical protein
MTIMFNQKNITHWELRCNALRNDRNAMYDLLRGIAAQLHEARLEHDWLTVSNVECAIEAALAGKDAP